MVESGWSRTSESGAHQLFDEIWVPGGVPGTSSHPGKRPSSRGKRVLWASTARSKATMFFDLAPIQKGRSDYGQHHHPPTSTRAGTRFTTSQPFHPRINLRACRCIEQHNLALSPVLCFRTRTSRTMAAHCAWTRRRLLPPVHRSRRDDRTRTDLRFTKQNRHSHEKQPKLAIVLRPLHTTIRRTRPRNLYHSRQCSL